MNVNKVLLVGRLTDAPDFRKTTTGQSVCTIRVATNRMWTDNKTGQKREDAEYHTVVLWARLADIASQYLQKGKTVFIEGRLRTHSWQDATGTKKYRTEIIAENMQLGPRTQDAPPPAPPVKDEEPSSAKASEGEEIPIIEEEEEIDVKDIPF